VNSYSSIVIGLIVPRVVGVGMFICTFIYMYVWVYTSEATSKRIRERYLKAILHQNIAFFDDVGPGEITTRIQTDTRAWFFSIPVSHWGIDSRHQIWSIRAYLRRLPSPSASSLHFLPVSRWHMQETGGWLWL
jgi:hypothetical protein